MTVSGRRRDLGGFTILEIMTVMMVILILFTLMVPGYEQIRARLDKVACTNNLRNLYVGASSYVQDHGSWPQVNPALLQQPNNAYDEAWIQDFMPYGVSRGTWICPTIQRGLGGPDYNQLENHRADYVAMPFDSKHITPYRWAMAPWFAERGNVHGNGNLVILTAGAVIEVNGMPKPASAAASSPSH
jgi:type II secretory pathway pseudopilin PulG